MNEYVDLVIAAITSGTAAKILFISASILALALSAIAAWYASGYVTQDHALPGRRPSTPDGWRKRRERLGAIKAKKLRYQALAFGITVVCGVLLPSLILYSILTHAVWLYGDENVIIRACSEPCSAQSHGDPIVWYIASMVQTAMVADVFQKQIALPPSTITANPDNPYALTTIFLFRSYMQLYVASWITTAAKGVRVAIFRVDTKINRQIAEADHEIEKSKPH